MKITTHDVWIELAKIEAKKEIEKIKLDMIKVRQEVKKMKESVIKKYRNGTN